MDSKQTDENQSKQRGFSPAPTRRAFLATATISLSALLLDANLGCSDRREAPNAADIENRSSLNSVPAHLVTFRESLTIPTSMIESRGVAVAPDGSIWVVGDSELARLAPGSAQWRLPLPAPPTCLAIADDRIYVGLGNRVMAYDGHGKLVAEWTPISPSAIITSIAPARDRVWVADWAGKLVYGYDPTGVVRTTLCARNEEAGYPGLIAPSAHLDVVVAERGLVYVANPGMHRIETHASDGALVSFWGAPGNDFGSFCGCCNPVDFAMMPDGCFVTGEKGIPRVKIHAPDGRFVEYVAGPDQFASNTMSLDLAVTRDGRVLVLDAIQQAVRVYSRITSPPREVVA